MTDAEFRARIEELEAVAGHVPPAVLAKRLLAAIEDRIGGGFEAINVWDRFDGLSESVEAPLWSEEVHRRTRTALESAEALAAARLEEIGRLEDVLREERIRNERPEPPEIFDPGIPTDSSALAMVADEPEAPAAPSFEVYDPKVPAVAAERGGEDRVEPTPAEADRRQFPDDPRSVEGKKLCKECDEEKPRSEFERHNKSADGYRSKCKDCGAEGRDRQKEASRRWARGRTNVRAADPEAAAEPRNAAPTTGERRCANGPRCVVNDGPFGEPAILDASNPDPLCRRCQKRAGVA